MNRKLKIKTLVISLSLLIFIGVGVFFFVGIIARERVSEVNLYSLVPCDCTAVFETEELTTLLKEMKDASCAKVLPSLRLSRIANDLREHFDQLTMPAPHGLSSRMNRMLISFHSPGTELDQVIYFCTTPGDEEWIEQQIQKNRPIDFPVKTTSYKGRKIEIYPMGGDLFLCYYKSAGFIAASYSKRLLELVIDTHISGKSVLSDPVFGLSNDSKRSNSIASLHLKMQQIGWSELDIKFGNDAIYLSGVTVDADTSSSFVNALKEQSPIEFISYKEFPRSTYYINEMAISQFQYIAANASQREYAQAFYADEVKETDIHMMRFLKEHAFNRLAGISFYPEDSIHRPLSLLYIPVKDSIKAEKELQLLLQNGSVPAKIASIRKSQLLYAGVKSFRLYSLPRNTTFSQLSGIKDADLNSYAVFYKNLLLIAPEPVSILSYITQVEKNQVAEGDTVYQECVSRLAPHFNYMLMADLEKVCLHPESRSRFIPEFFFQHIDFFSHFILSTQFVCKDGVIYPNLTLTYKENESGAAL